LPTDVSGRTNENVSAQTAPENSIRMTAACARTNDVRITMRRYILLQILRSVPKKSDRSFIVE